jgi:opacity protein-like surface antigen
MKRIHWSLAAVVMLLGFATLAAPAAAQNMLGTLEVNGGYAKSSNEVTASGESMGGGLTFGAAYWRSISPSVSWGAEVSMDNLGNVEETDPLTATTTEVSSKVLRINPAIRMNFGAPVGPSFFAQGGAGMYNVSSEVTSGGVSGDDSQSKIGFNFGAGVGFPVGPKTKLNFQGNYHTVSTEGESINYITFRAGVGFGL